MAEVVSARLTEDVLSLLDDARGDASRGAWLTELVARELSGGGSQGRPAPGARSLGPGIPAPGVACAWPSCWGRDSDRYGVTDPAELTRGGYRDRPRDEGKCGIVLCKAHAAMLEGREYRRPAAARAGRLGRPAT